MTLLDDAKRLLNECALIGERDDNYRDLYTCTGCSATQEWEIGFPHEPNCPWRSMPKIVAVLEIAQRIAEDMPLDERHDGGCYYCTGWRDHHDPECPWGALKAAL